MSIHQKIVVFVCVTLANLACEIEFKPRPQRPFIAGASDAGHFTDDADSKWVRGEITCIVNSDCPPGQWCIDREWCYTPVEDGAAANGEVSGDSDAKKKKEKKKDEIKTTK